MALKGGMFRLNARGIVSILSISLFTSFFFPPFWYLMLLNNCSSI